MNVGLMYKSFREWLPITAVVGLLVMAFEIILAYVAPTFEEQLADVLSQIGWLKNILQSLLGTELGDQLSPQAFSVLPWIQPVLLLTFLSHAILGATRVPCNEIERGTIDLLMALPVSRLQLFLTESFVWIVNGLIVLGILLLGNQIGQNLVQSEFGIDLSTCLLIAVNLFCLYLACGGMAWLASVLIDRRMVAMGSVVSVLFASILFNFLTPYWAVAKSFSFLSIMNYFRPFEILTSGQIPVVDVAVLLSIFAVSWIIAAAIFGRRDLAAV